MHPALENLCGPGKSLKAETSDANEIAGLLRTAPGQGPDCRDTVGGGCIESVGCIVSGLAVFHDDERAS
jgi:hypothetical protein